MKKTEEQNRTEAGIPAYLEVSYQNRPCYRIVYENDFTALAATIQDLGLNPSKVGIITDSNVEQLFGATVVSELKKEFQEVELFSFPAGEASKNLATVQTVYQFLIEHHFERKDLLVALGGGVVGDLCGFVAATYLRGVDFVQVPTTLLSQVDSSIGGKTGVDFDAYKNMVGAFKMPRLVYSNINALQELPVQQFFSGMGEVLKHGLIKDGKYYEWLINHFAEIGERDTDTLREMIYRSNVIKKNVVEKDPTEQGDRALLNFGHTLGHAIEKYKNFELLHGECVALGSICAAFISYKRGYLSTEDYYEIRDMFVPFELPISIEKIDLPQIVELTHSDKKMEKGMIKFILLQKIGKACIATDVTPEEMLEALNEIYYNEEENE